MTKHPLTTIGLALFLTLPASAADPPERREDPRREDASRDRLKLRMEQLLWEEMQKELQLSEVQAAALRPLLQEMNEAQRTHFKARRKEVRSLVERSHDPSVTDGELEAAFASFRAAEREFLEAQRSRDAAMQDILTPRQRIQYLPFAEGFSRRMKRKLRELREERSGERGEHRRRRPRGPRTPPPSSEGAP